MNIKQTLCVCILCVSTILPIAAKAGTNDDITNACYLTSKCGAKSSIKNLAALIGARRSALAGFVSPIPGGMIMDGYAGYVVDSNLGGKISVSYEAKEYLYFGDQCLVCDTYQIGKHYECPNGTIVTNGSDVFKCRTGFTDDVWEKFSLPICSDSPIQDKQATGTKAEIKATVSKSLDGASGVIVASGDACLYITCGNSGEYNSAKKECVSSSCKDAYVSCLDSQTKMGAKNCYRKCHYDKQGSTTMIVECESTFSPAEENKGWKTHDGKRLYAKCVKKAVSAVAVAVAPVVTNPNPDSGQPVAVYTCDATIMATIANWKVACAENSEIIQQIAQIDTYCASADKTQEGFMSLYTALLGLNPQNCALAPEPSEEEKLCDKIPDAHMVGDECRCNDEKKQLNRTTMRCDISAQAQQQLISSIVSNLNRLKDGLNTSVWKLSLIHI